MLMSILGLQFEVRSKHQHFDIKAKDEFTDLAFEAAH